MKVMCITDSPKTKYNIIGIFPMREEDRVYCGEIYNVIYIEMNLGVKVFTLSERPKNIGYNSQYFIPISDIDETEMVRESISEKVNQ